jgi:hypothetical protein
MLQSKKAKFSNNKETDICKLCYLETEDIEHFLIKYLAEFLTSLHMDVVTESSGDLFNVHVVLILEFDHACNTVHGRIQYKL